MASSTNKPPIETVDIVAALVGAVAVLGLLYWLWGRGGHWGDFGLAAAFLLGAGAAMALAIGGLIWAADRLFRPGR